MGTLGTLWGHPWVNSSISRGMGGQETISLAWGRSEPFQGSWAYLGPCGVTPGTGQVKKRGFSDFGMNAVLHREISKEESGKSFDSTSTSKIYMLLLYGE